MSLRSSLLTLARARLAALPSLAMAASAAAAPAAAGASAPSFSAPAIPTTYRASFNSWLHGATRDTAAAELHLYARASPYFAGATLGNAPNAPLARAFEIASSPDGAPEDIDPPGVAGRASVARSRASDGKVGALRAVDIGPAAQTATGWFAPRAQPRLVHMLEIGTPEESAAEEKVVMLHGYGAGECRAKRGGTAAGGGMKCKG
jgi:hypothetical protein